jgi:hypothetical protein
MLKRNLLCTGTLYTHDSWSHYWEGGLERVNGNIGTVTTQTVVSSSDYAILDRLNLISMVPYVWTDASSGVLRGQHGFQDFTLAAKVRAYQTPVKSFGTLSAIAVISGSIPLTNYTPDLQPLSIGSHSNQATGRATLNFQAHDGLYVNATTAYTLRGNVTLDRSSYYTNGQLVLSNQVAMPNVFDYMVSAGYHKRDLEIVGNYEQQQMRGGGDIRRQDLPFVSNRMNYSRAGVQLQYPIPKLRDLQFWFSYMNTFEGRNVGQANTFTTGLMYTIHLPRGVTR